MQNAMKRSIQVTLIGLAAVLISACETYSIIHEERDSGPDVPVDVSHIPEPVPRLEPRTIAGNKSPYTVLGKTYHVMPNPNGYIKKGVASWYGRKFHGRRTSNGEIYDMYGMTAAHKTLPIPSYVRVTNVKNKRSIIVRVNDRGPFHDDREIDLTYTAAKKLGFENTGTAHVVVEYIDPAQTLAQQTNNFTTPTQVQPTGEPAAPTPEHSGGYRLPENTFLQVGAFSQASAAMGLRERVETFSEHKVIVLPPKKHGDLYRVHVGPFSDNLAILAFREVLQSKNFPDPHVVYP